MEDQPGKSTQIGFTGDVDEGYYGNVFDCVCRYNIERRPGVVDPRHGMAFSGKEQVMKTLKQMEKDGYRFLRLGKGVLLKWFLNTNHLSTGKRIWQ